MPDEALLKDVSRQRHDALTELYGRHGQRLRAIIDSVVHEKAEADDVLQEILSNWGTSYEPGGARHTTLLCLRISVVFSRNVCERCRDFNGRRSSLRSSRE